MDAVTRPGARAAPRQMGGVRRPEDVRGLPARSTQWVGVMLAPATFFVHLQVGYVLVPRACRYHAGVWLHVAGLLSVVLAAAGALVARRVWTEVGREPDVEGDDARTRARFMGIVGAGMGALFTLLLLAQWAAVFFIDPCQ